MAAKDGGSYFAQTCSLLIHRLVIATESSRPVPTASQSPFHYPSIPSHRADGRLLLLLLSYSSVFLKWSASQTRFNQLQTRPNQTRVESHHTPFHTPQGQHTHTHTRAHTKLTQFVGNEVRLPTNSTVSLPPTSQFQRQWRFRNEYHSWKAPSGPSYNASRLSVSIHLNDSMILRGESHRCKARGESGCTFELFYSPWLLTSLRLGVDAVKQHPPMVPVGMVGMIDRISGGIDLPIERHLPYEQARWTTVSEPLFEARSYRSHRHLDLHLQLESRDKCNKARLDVELTRRTY